MKKKTKIVNTEEYKDKKLAELEDCWDKLNFLGSMMTNVEMEDLIVSKEDFLVIKRSDRCYLETYRRLRTDRVSKGTWTEKEDDRYISEVESWAHEYS